MNNRRADDALVPQILQSLEAVNSRLERLEGALEKNSRRTDQVYEETRDVVKMVNQGRGFFAVCDWIAGKVKMLTLVIGGIGAVLFGFYEYFKTRWFK